MTPPKTNIYLFLKALIFSSCAIIISSCATQKASPLPDTEWKGISAIPEEFIGSHLIHIMRFANLPVFNIQDRKAQLIVTANSVKVARFIPEIGCSNLEKVYSRRLGGVLHYDARYKDGTMVFFSQRGYSAAGIPLPPAERKWIAVDIYHKDKNLSLPVNLRVD